MFKAKNYVYGDGKVVIPSNVNFGAYILDKLWRYKEGIALINAETSESLTYREMARKAMNLAVSLVRYGVRKGDTMAIVSENNQDYFSTVFGIACTGATITTINPWYTEEEITHALNISKPKYVFCSRNAFEVHAKVFLKHVDIKQIFVYGTEETPNTIPFNDLVAPAHVDGDGEFKKENVKNNATGTDNNKAFVDVKNNVIQRLADNVKYEEFVAVDVVGQEDVLFVLYSSGTTGLSKGVMLTHHNVLSLFACDPIQFTEGIVLAVGPWFHAMGLMGLMNGFADRNTIAYLPKFEVRLCLRTIELYKVSMLYAPPAVLVSILKANLRGNLTSVTRILTGSAPMHPDVMAEISRVFPKIEVVRLGYGLTETTLAVARNDVTDQALLKAGTVGKLMPNLVLKIIGEDEKTLGPNQRGEICVKGDIVMKGYLGSTASPFDAEGFLRTGDIGYYDEEGHLFVVDRMKELIKYKGYQVPPAEIESMLIQHDAVKEVGVVGIRDKEAGELPLAFVALQPGRSVTEKELQDYVAERLSNPKHLRGGVRFLAEIPRNTTGKILRNALRRMANERSLVHSKY